MSERVILHSDMNCFYASVEMLHHPEFAGMPLAVGGDPEARHGIVLTANYIAKKKGVKTGMALCLINFCMFSIYRHFGDSQVTSWLYFLHFGDYC